MLYGSKQRDLLSILIHALARCGNVTAVPLQQRGSNLPKIQFLGPDLGIHRQLIGHQIAPAGRFAKACGSTLGAIDDAPVVALLLGAFDNTETEQPVPKNIHSKTAAQRGGTLKSEVTNRR